jgi:hypothetical protein
MSVMQFPPSLQDMGIQAAVFLVAGYLLKFFISFSSLRTNQERIADWVGMLCTFYWSNTNEISRSSQKTRGPLAAVDFQSLLAALGTEFEIELSTPPDQPSEESLLKHQKKSRY